MTAPLDPLLVPGGSGDRPVGGDVDADLPGRDQPDWLWPVLVVAFAALIAWLAIFGPEATEPVAESPATSSPDDAAVPVATESDAAPGPSDDDAASVGDMATFGAARGLSADFSPAGRRAGRPSRERQASLTRR